MLPLRELQGALKRCETETFWKPAWPKGILCVPLSDEGMSGGVAIGSYKQRHIFQGLTIAVNETRDVKVGDLINADYGRFQELTTYLGERMVYINEDMLSGVDEEFNA